MLVTLFGIVILVSLEQSRNIFVPMLVKLGLLVDRVALVRAVQPWNASSPMLVTLFGITILVNLEQ